MQINYIKFTEQYIYNRYKSKNLAKDNRRINLILYYTYYIYTKYLKLEVRDQKLEIKNLTSIDSLYYF